MFAIDIFQDFNTLLKLAINNTLKLHTSINKSLGLLLNQLFYEENPNLTYYLDADNIYRWVGGKYSLWSISGASAWLYENKNKIILEITSTYNWDPNKDQNISEQEFQEFIKNYKPYLKTVIEKDYVLNLIDQTEELIKIVKSNTDKLLKKSK